MCETEVYEHFGDDISGDEFFLVEKAHPRRVEGFPIDPISVHIASGEYYADRTTTASQSNMSKGFQTFFRRVIAQNNEKP